MSLPVDGTKDDNPRPEDEQAAPATQAGSETKADGAEEPPDFVLPGKYKARKTRPTAEPLGIRVTLGGSGADTSFDGGSNK